MTVPLIAFDTETTGTTVYWNEVIDIGASVLDPKTLLPTERTFERKLRIEKPERVTPGVLGVYNHYNEAQWAEQAVSQVQGYTELGQWLFDISEGGVNRPVLVIKNAKFDYYLIDFWSQQFGIKLPISYHTIDLDTSFAAFRLRNGFSLKNNKLEAMCELLGVVNPQAHSALADAMTAGVCYALTEKYMDALIDLGRGYSHAEMMKEVWYRVGHAGPEYVPLVPKRSPVPA